MDAITPPNATAFATLLFVKFREHVEEVLARSSTIPSYTPHGQSHIQGVEAALAYLAAFLDREQCLPLSPLERILLRFCAWSHDLGMIEEVAHVYQKYCERPQPYDNEMLRKEHDKASAHYVQEKVPEQFNVIQNSLQTHVTMAMEIARGVLMKRAEAELNQTTLSDTITFFQNSANRQRWSALAATLANTVNLIASYHRRAEDIEKAWPLRHFLNEPIRLRLLAAIFRLADALHVDRTRFEQTGYDLLSQSPQFTDESRVHWIKSLIVSSIRIDEDAHTVHVQADVPVARELGGSDFAVNSERMRGMLDYIVNDLKEDVLSVSRILLDAKFPPLLGVSSEIHEIPGMRYEEEVRSALNHIYASSSPNTSRLITIALDVMEYNLRKGKELMKKVKEQRRSLAEQLKHRSCHEALRKVHDLLAAVDNAWMHKDFPKEDLLHLCEEEYMLGRFIDGVRETFRYKRDEVMKGANNDQFQQVFDGRTDVILYGYSEQVLALLAKLNTLRSLKPHVHVLECRTKTAYAPAGDLLYLDGERYAHALKRTGYQGHIMVEPDAAVGRILTKSAAPLVLLGSNAVYPSGEFVHSMGHLSVAAAAKAPHLEGKCRVVVLTDSMKIGFRHDPQSHERNEDKWLTTRKDVIERLKSAGIVLRNWQEDLVPAVLIDNLLILDAAEKDRILDRMQLSHPDRLNRLRFAASDDYTLNLETRLLAGYIAYNFGWLSKDKQEKIIERAGERRNINDGNWNIAVAYLAKDETLYEPIRIWLDGTWQQHAWAVQKAKEIVAEEYANLALVQWHKQPEKPALPAPQESQYNVRATTPASA